MPYLAPLRPIRLLACAALAAGLSPAWSCSASESGGALGSVSSLRIKDGAAVTGSGAFSFTCGAVVLSALAGTPSLRATLQPSVSGLTLKSGANAIPYQIYSAPGQNGPYTGGLLVVNLSGTTLLGLLNGAGAQVPVYIATTPGANIPAGTYTDNLQLTWTYQNICEGLVNIAGLCLGTLNNGTAVRTVGITLTVSNDCTITAPNIVFGSAPLISGFGTVSDKLSLVCTKGMVYTVGLSAGGDPQGGRRRMASGANRLAYDIFKPDNTVWGSVGTARAAGPGAADGTSVQQLPYTATIYPNQSTPPAGSYSDSIVVDVSF